MKKTGRKILAAILSLVMIATMCPAVAFAADQEVNAESVNDLQYANIGGVTDKYYSEDADNNKQDLEDIEVELEGAELTPDVDYQVSYENIDKVGTATIIFKGIGDYTGEQPVYYELTTMDNAIEATFTARQLAVGQTETMALREENQAEGINVGINSETAKSAVTADGTYVSVKYKGTRYVDDGYTDPYNEYLYTITANKKGSGEITVVAPGNASYSKTSKSYAITVSSNAITGKCITLKKKKFTYDGTAKKPGVVVKKDGKTLKNGRDYSVTYKNNIKAGQGTVVVRGRGTYSGSAEKYFTIKKAAQKISVTVSSKKIVAGGSASITQKPAGGTVNIGVFTYKSSNTSILTVKRDSVTHNCTVTGKSQGTATVTITAAATDNLKAAKQTITFKVTGSGTLVTITKKMVTLKPTTRKVGQYPTITVTYKGQVLKYGTDYKYWITDEKKPGTAHVHLWGVGKFTGDVYLTYKVVK